jgi:hypothetical protein
MTAPNRRLYIGVWLFVAVAASFSSGWVAGRANLRHQQEQMWEREDDPFAHGHVAPRDSQRKDFVKGYLRFSKERDYQMDLPLPSTERSGMSAGPASA